MTGQRVFELESGKGNVDGQTNRQKTGQTNRRNYTNFEWNLAMMVIYLPVKFGQTIFELESGNENVDGQTDGRQTHQFMTIKFAQNNNLIKLQKFI